MRGYDVQTMTPARPFGEESDRTMPIPVVTAYAAPRRSRSGAARLAVVVASGVLALVLTATTAVVLVARGTTPATPVVATAPAGAPAPVVTPVVPVDAAEPGPALVDTNGDPVDPELAAAVTRVYRAIEANDLESVRKAYSASGSDDWFTAEPQLRSATVRADVRTALRQRPSAHEGYLYAAGGYMVQFGQGDRYARPGLLSIQGPWSYEVPTVSVEPSSPAPEVSAPATSSPQPWNLDGCAAGTVEDPTEGHPCRDPETGRGVDRDGTVGVHGLKPCPYGTTVPSDPDEPTRNASTGEICGL